jgi:hypothetical protein
MISQMAFKLIKTPWKWPILASLACVATVALAFIWSSNSTSVKEISYEDLVADLYQRFEPDNPGFGYADYPGDMEVHIPKSYAAILLAEIERTRGGLLSDRPSLAAVAGNWLLDNDDINADGEIGWGVPIAWDAYGDGSENPKDTVYTISTAIVVDALLTWMERDGDAPKQRIFEVVTNALRPFSDPQMRSPSGMLPYSFVKSDREYDTFNPAAYMAGQLQRFSNLTPDAELAQSLKEAADDTVQVLIDEKKVNSTTGSWYWNYSIQENVTNDLPHASYIIEGLRTYSLYGGKLSNEIDFDAVLLHLREYINDKPKYVRAWPLLQSNIDRPARTYDLGMAMSLACSFPHYADLAATFSSEIHKYRDGNRGYLKYPVGSDFAEPLIVNEYEAYLYRGAVDCTLLNDRTKKSSSIPAAPLKLQSERSLSFEKTEFPLTIPLIAPSENGTTNVRLTDNVANHFLLEEKDRNPIEFDQEIPIGHHVLSENRAIFSRNIPTNRLKLTLFGRDGKSLQEIVIHHSEGSEPIYRKSKVVGSNLFLVYYDNITLRNYLTYFKIEKQKLTQIGKAVEAPLLEDPAGRTYEMIPAVFLLSYGNERIGFLGGTVNGVFNLKDHTFTEKRVDNCLKIIEAVEALNDALILCQKVKTEENSSAFFLAGPGDISLPTFQDRQLPYNLNFENGKISLSFANDAASFVRMLKFDLNRIHQNGWMEFGTNNDEGRIPWSQIYYLNGILDFFKVAHLTPEISKSFEYIIRDLKVRLDLEMLLVDQHWQRNRIATRGFTVDRSYAIFAVQTSRLLLLMERYLNEVTNISPITGYPSAQIEVACLKNHIEKLVYGGQPIYWMKPQSAGLKWPHGSGFYFDGLNVPYNHQNEWSYAIRRATNSTHCPQADKASSQIIDNFMRHIAPSGVFPNNGVWDYWWGTAYDGWTGEEMVSLHKPSYPGDKIKAWISFRTIDLMAVLSHFDDYDEMTRANLLLSVRHQIYHGHVYPFANYELVRLGQAPLLDRKIAEKYVRVTSPWELQNAAWAYWALFPKSGNN